MDLNDMLWSFMAEYRLFSRSQMQIHLVLFYQIEAHILYSYVIFFVQNSRKDFGFKIYILWKLSECEWHRIKKKNQLPKSKKWPTVILDELGHFAQINFWHFKFTAPGNQSEWLEEKISSDYSAYNLKD